MGDEAPGKSEVTLDDEASDSPVRASAPASDQRRNRPGQSPATGTHSTVLQASATLSEASRPLRRTPARRPARSGKISELKQASPLELSTVARAHYEFGWEVARGGLGKIIAAKDLRLDRMVAVKELLRQNSVTERRFLREIEVTVRLQHPNIVSVYEAGRWPDGRLFYAMSFVAGETLLHAIESASSLSLRLDLLPAVLSVCEAVAFAHNEGVIHRDLKPANVLVGRFGETVVIDWGLAKYTTRPIDAKSTLVASSPEVDTTTPPGAPDTMAGQVVGTPPYLPPEQAAGEEVNEASDVYALGALLYHVLAGRMPFVEHPSSDRLDRIIDTRPMSLSALEPELPPDLVAIVEKAMSKNQKERYVNAEAMAAELRDFKSGLLVKAYTYRPLELVLRFARRNAPALTTALAALLVLVLGTVYSMRRVEKERDDAKTAQLAAQVEEQRADERANALIIAQAESLTLSDPTEAVATLKQLQDSRTKYFEVAMRAEELGVASQVLTAHDDVVQCVDSSADGFAVTGGGGGDVHLWHSTRDFKEGIRYVHTYQLASHAEGVTGCRFSPDGRYLLTAAHDGVTRLYERPFTAPPQELNHQAEVKALAFHPTQALVVTATADDFVHFWSATDYAAVRQLNVRRPVLAFSPATERLLSGPHAGAFGIWTDVVGVGSIKQPVNLGYRRTNGQLGLPTAAIWLQGEANPERVLYGDDQGVIYLATLGSQSPIASLPSGITTLHETHSGIIAITTEGEVYLLNTPTASNKPVPSARLLGRHDERLEAVAISSTGSRAESNARSHEGRLVAVGGWDRSVYVYDLQSGERQALRGHSGVISDLSFAWGDTLLLSASSDRSVRAWDLSAPLHRKRRTLQVHRSGVSTAGFSPDGQRVASGGQDNKVVVWDLENNNHTVFHGHTDRVSRAIFSPSGEWVASSSDDNTVRLWSQTGRPHRVLTGHTEDVGEIVFSPFGGRYLLSASEDHTARLWDLQDDSARIFHHGDAVVLANFLSHGDALLTLTRSSEFQLFDIETLQPVVLENAETTAVSAAAVGPNGMFALAESGGEIRLFRYSQTTSAPESTEHHIERISAELPTVAEVHLIALDPKGRAIAFVGKGPSLWVCPLPSTVAGCINPKSQLSALPAVSFSPNANLLLSAGSDGELSLLDWRRNVRRSYLGHTASVFDANFSPKGEPLMVSGSADGSVRVWPVVAPAGEDDLDDLLERLTDSTLYPSGP